MNKSKIFYCCVAIISTPNIIGINAITKNYNNNNEINKSVSDSKTQNDLINYKNYGKRNLNVSQYKTINFLDDFRTFCKKPKYTNYDYINNGELINISKQDLNLVHNESKLKLKTQRLDKWADWNWKAYLAQHNQVQLNPLTTYSDDNFFKNINNVLTQAISSVFINPKYYVEDSQAIKDYINKYGTIYFALFKKYMWRSIKYRICKLYKENNMYYTWESSQKELGSNALYIRPELNPETAKSSFYSYGGPTNYINDYVLGHNYDTIDSFNINEIIKYLSNPFKTKNILSINNNNLKYSFNQYHLSQNDSSKTEKDVNSSFDLTQSYRIYDDSLNGCIPYNNTNPNILFNQNNNDPNWYDYVYQKQYFLYKFNILNSFQNIYINFSNLFEFDVSDYYNNNNQWIKPPKINLKFNEEIFNAFKEQANISNLMIKVFEKINEIFKFNNSLKNNFINFINDIYYKKIGLNEIQIFLDQLKNSNGTNINYNIASNDAIANYAKILIANEFDSISTTSNLLVDKMNQISNWRLVYEQCLSSIFSNDIYVTIKQNTKNGIELTDHKIFDGTTKQFIPYEIKSYGIQQETYNNEVEVNFSNIYMKRNSTNEIISGLNSKNNTLNIKNIAKNSALKSNATLNNDSINFKFSYNPDLKPIDVPITSNYSILNCGNLLVSDLDDYIGQLYFMPMYKDRINEILQIPQNVWNKFKPNRKYGNNWTNTLVWDNPVISDWSTVPQTKANIHPDLKKFINLRYKWKESITISNNEQNELDALKKYNDLGYVYATFKFLFPLEYYIPNSVWTELITDGSIIKLKDEPDGYTYALKFDACGRMLDYKNLEKYLKINTPIETNCVENKINTIHNNINEIKNIIMDLQMQLNNEINISKDLIEKQKQLIIEIQNDFNIFINSDQQLNNKYKNVLDTYNTVFDNIKNQLENSYNEFKKDDEYISKDVVYLQKNKTFNYLNQLKELENINITTSTDIIKILNENTNWVNTKKCIIQKYNDYKNLVDLNKLNIKNIINELNLQSASLDSKINELNSINEMDYYYDQTIEFDIFKMLKDTNVDFRSNDITSSIDDYYTTWIGNDNRLEWWFAASPQNFVNKLNEILTTKTGIYFNVDTIRFKTNAIDKNNILHSNYVPVGFESDHQNDMVDHNGCNGNGFNSAGTWYWFEYVHEKNRVKKAIFHITIEVDKSLKIKNIDNNVNGTIDKIKKTTDEVINIKNQLENSLNIANNQLNNYSTLVLEPNKTLIEIQNAIKNYKPIVSYNKKINIGVVSGIVIGILICISLFVGLVIYIKSKKQIKLESLTDEEKQAIEEHKKWEDDFFK